MTRLCLQGNDDCDAVAISRNYGSFHFLDYSLSLRPKTEIKRLNFGLNPELRLTNHCSAHHCSLHNVIADIALFIYQLAKK